MLIFAPKNTYFAPKNTYFAPKNTYFSPKNLYFVFFFLEIISCSKEYLFGFEK